MAGPGDLLGAITQQPKRQFTSGLKCVKARDKSFLTRKFHVKTRACGILPSI